MVRRSCSVLLALLLVAVSNCYASDEETATAAPPTGPWFLLAEPPNSLERIIEEQPYTINLTLSYNSTDAQDAYDTANTFIVRISMSNSLTLKLSDDNLEFTWDDVVKGNQKALEVVGQVIGYVQLDFKMEVRKNNESAILEEHDVLKEYLVTVVRLDNTLDRIFTL